MRNSENQPTDQTVFRGNRLVGNFLVIIALLASAGAGNWEISVHQYLRGFWGAMVPATPVNQVQATLSRVRIAPPRFELNQLSVASPCDPLETFLLLERRSYFYRFLAVSSSVFLMLTRVVLAWIADHRFRISCSHFCKNLARATAVFFTSPEIE